MSSRDVGCVANLNDWLEVYAVNGAGQVMASGTIYLHSPGAPTSLTLSGVTLADSTAEHIDVKYRATTFTGTHTLAVPQWYYNNQRGSGQTVQTSGPPFAYYYCTVYADWSPQPPPQVAMVFVQPRYDTLFVGSSGATYGARAYAADGFTEIFTTGSATWTNSYPSIISVTSTSPGSGPFGYPTAVVSANNLGTAILNISRQGATGGGQITVVPVNGGGGCGLPLC